MKLIKYCAFLSLLVCGCQLEETPVSTLELSVNKIEEIRPVGKLQVLSSLMENFDKDEVKEGIFSKGYMQILREYCSYTLDLNLIKYHLVPDSKKVEIEMVYPQAECLLQDSPFLSDDEEYWAKNISLAQLNNIKKSIHLKNLRNFSTPENRLKAQKYSEDFIRKIFANLGLETEITWQ